METIKMIFSFIFNRQFLIGGAVGIVIGKWGIPAGLFLYHLVQSAQQVPK